MVLAGKEIIPYKSHRHHHDWFPQAPSDRLTVDDFKLCKTPNQSLAGPLAGLLAPTLHALPASSQDLLINHVISFRPRLPRAWPHTP